MTTTRKQRSTTVKTIALAATIFASATAIATIALIEPPSDAEMAPVSFDVAPPVTPSVAATPERPSPLLSAAVSPRASTGRPGATRPANDPWSADESSAGTRPDAMH